MVGWKNVTGAVYELEVERKDASVWSVKKPAGFDIDATKLRGLLDDLSHLRAEKFVSRDARLKAAFDAKVKAGNHVLTVTLTVEDEKEPLSLTVVNLNVPMDKEDEKLGADRGYYASTPKLPGDIFLLPKNRDGKPLFEGPMSKPTYFSP
jgi:hypothetical protein